MSVFASAIQHSLLSIITCCNAYP